MYTEMNMYSEQEQNSLLRIIWQQMLTEIQTCKGSHDAQNLLETKQIAKPAQKVKMKSMLLKAIKIIGPWIYLHMYDT